MEATNVGILLPCPMCGERESSIRVHMEDGTFSCAACGRDFDQEDIETLIAKWSRVLSWMESMLSDE